MLPVGRFDPRRSATGWLRSLVEREGPVHIGVVRIQAQCVFVIVGGFVQPAQRPEYVGAGVAEERIGPHTAGDMRQELECEVVPIHQPEMLGEHRCLTQDFFVGPRHGPDEPDDFRIFGKGEQAQADEADRLGVVDPGAYPRGLQCVQARIDITIGDLRKPRKAKVWRHQIGRYRQHGLVTGAGRGWVPGGLVVVRLVPVALQRSVHGRHREGVGSSISATRSTQAAAHKKRPPEGGREESMERCSCSNRCGIRSRTGP